MVFSGDLGLIAPRFIRKNHVITITNNPLSAKKSKVKVTLCQSALLSGFIIPYHFSIAILNSTYL